MSIKNYVRNTILSGPLLNKVIILCCFCLIGIVFFSSNHGQRMHIKLSNRQDSYIQYHMKELKQGKVQSAFDFKIYTGNSNIHSEILTTTPHVLVATDIPLDEQTLLLSKLKSGSSFDSKAQKVALSKPTIRPNDKLKFEENKEASHHGKERIPIIDNTDNFRPETYTNEPEVHIKQSEQISTENNIQLSEISQMLRKEESLSQTLILLVTYLRSGSTFTADLIQQASDVFYLYEPLKPYVRGQHYFTLDSVCHIINGTCRRQTGRRENIDRILDDLSKFYNCDLFHVPINYFRFSNKSRTMLEFDRCRHRKTQYKCLYEFKEKCRKSVKMIKTIRMNMDVAEKLLEEFPTLKLINLIRDPRGSYQSRRNGYFMRNQNNLNAITKSNCDTLNADLRTGFRLKELFPGRTKTLLYEKVAEEPLRASRSIFRFLGLTEPANFEAWLTNHTKARRSNGYYDTIRRNSTVTAYLWRKYINVKVVKSYDKNCEETYRTLGLRAFDNYRDLRNSSIPSRYSSPVFGDFLD